MPTPGGWPLRPRLCLCLASACTVYRAALLITSIGSRSLQFLTRLTATFVGPSTSSVWLTHKRCGYRCLSVSVAGVVTGYARARRVQLAQRAAAFLLSSCALLGWTAGREGTTMA